MKRKVRVCTFILSASLLLLSLSAGASVRWRQVAKLTASDGTVLGGFAISGDTVVAVGGGAAYVFVKPVSGWRDMPETAKLTASAGYALVSVAISGDTVIAGVPSAPKWGAAYVFEKPESGWANMTEAAKLSTWHLQSHKHRCFGCAVAIDGDTVVVGDPAWMAHRVYVFVRRGAEWKDMRLATAVLFGGYRFAGTSLAIGGDTIVVGASGTNYFHTNSGVYVFVKPATGWVDMVATASLRGSNNRHLGRGSIAFAGNTVVAGVPARRQRSRGEAYVFVKPQTGWADMTETAELTARYRRPGDNFGASVATTGDIAVVGIPGIDVGSDYDQGVAEVFVKPESGWVTKSGCDAKVTAADGAAGYRFGDGMAMSGDTLVVAASSVGTAYVFEKKQ